VSVKQYNKIVRDNIPKIIESRGRMYKTRTATKEETIYLLKAQTFDRKALL